MRIFPNSVTEFAAGLRRLTTTTMTATELTWHICSCDWPSTLIYASAKSLIQDAYRMLISNGSLKCVQPWQRRSTSNTIPLIPVSHQAIIHFSQKGDPRSEDHVDILTLSFCFPRYDDVFRPIYHAILKAQANGVIIFAASGNECGDAGLSWPVSLYEMGDVIRISSSDGKGPPSGYNLRLDIGRWICTLGQGVPSCQLQLGTDNPIYRSGSSLATPIAAAIAAIILGIVDHAYPVLFPQDMIVL